MDSSDDESTLNAMRSRWASGREMLVQTRQYQQEASMQEWPEQELVTVQDQNSTEFEKIENWYNSLKEPTMEDEVRYENAKMEEATRKKRVACRDALVEDQQLEASGIGDDQDELFCRQDEPDNSGASCNQPSEQDHHVQNSLPEPSPQEPEQSKGPQTKRKRQNRITAEEKRRSMRYGFELARLEAQKGSGKGRRKRKRNDHSSTSVAEAEEPANEPRRRRARKRRQSTKRHDYTGLFTTDIVADAQVNSSLPEAPAMEGRVKAKALTQLVASIPSSDQNQMRSDKQAVLKASKSFTNTARIDGQGGWKVKGMLTSLYHYQLIGAGFMRDRENSPYQPLGGMLCDVMGFGKTIQALANIVDGRPEDTENNPIKTTLIIVPPHLVSHWKRQILRHCDKKAIGHLLEYHAKSRLTTLDDDQTIHVIQDFAIVLTTYEEVRKSYPVYIAPVGVVDDSQIERGWNEVYQKDLGPLHRIKFWRILLDEAHVIKNDRSKTSIAVRALTGRYKWILSGTPIHNGLEEFYSYFDFLGVKHTGHYDDFVHNYIKDEKAQQRLTNVVRSIILRRTHASRLFSLPIIKLPDIGERTVEATLCDVEQVIYNRIFSIYIDNFNGMPRNKGLGRYLCLLDMILKLRMFSSHPLTIQPMLKLMLTDELMRQLIILSNQKKDNEHPSSKITRWLITLRKHITIPAKSGQPVKDQSNEAGQQNLENQEGQTPEPAQYLQGDREKLVRQFHAFMDQLHDDEQWMERFQRTTCPLCEMFPEEAIITSCKHLYCEECYCVLRGEHGLSGAGKPVCQRCDVDIEEAAHCGLINEFPLNVSESTPPSTSISQTQPSKKKRQPKGKKIQMTNRGTQGPFLSTFKSTGQPEPAPEEVNEDESTDWVALAAREMPGAKLTKVREVAANWIAENKEVKVVIFTQFLENVRILVAMCMKENWEYACFTGKMSYQARDKSMNEFREKKTTNILIASLKAGGIGLDLSMASKCILVDPWWNEAVQEQAMCRLYRIGQEQNVEFVKIIVKNTIDDYLVNIQNRKTAEIDGTLADEVLRQRQTVTELLDLFGAVPDSHSGGFILIPEHERREDQGVEELD